MGKQQQDEKKEKQLLGVLDEDAGRAWGPAEHPHSPPEGAVVTQTSTERGGQDGQEGVRGSEQGSRHHLPLIPEAFCFSRVHCH